MSRGGWMDGDILNFYIVGLFWVLRLLRLILMPWILLLIEIENLTGNSLLVRE